MTDHFRILVINPGSTSTKIAIFENEQNLFEKVIRHSSDELNDYKRIADQFEFRKEIILHTITEAGFNLSKLDAVCGRGGLLKPIKGGTYEVSSVMLDDLTASKYGEHASNLGALISHDIAHRLNRKAYVVDPVVVDELSELARYSGLPELPRKSIFHALNQKAVARKASDDLNQSYEESNLIVCHMGGGITVGAHKNGQVIDVNNGLNGEGPFSPERTGTLPVGDLVELCFSGLYSKEEIHKKLVGHGGLVAYLQTNDARVVETKIEENDQQAQLIYEAMAYQIAKEIGSASTVLSGDVDAIILTGGLAYGKSFTSMIVDRVSWIANVYQYPGESEMHALASGVLRVLRQEETAKEYK